MNDLFDTLYTVQDESVIETVDITQIIFYYSAVTATRFKKQCKEIMKHKFKDYIKDGNLSELMLILIDEEYARVTTKNTHDTSTGGAPAGEFLG